eukprot:4223353-Pyramimonas_sp.AAC.1
MPLEVPIASSRKRRRAAQATLQQRQSQLSPQQMLQTQSLKKIPRAALPLRGSEFSDARAQHRDRGTGKGRSHRAAPYAPVPAGQAASGTSAGW